MDGIDYSALAAVIRQVLEDSGGPTAESIEAAADEFNRSSRTTNSFQKEEVKRYFWYCFTAYQHARLSQQSPREDGDDSSTSLLTGQSVTQGVSATPLRSNRAVTDNYNPHLLQRLLVDGVFFFPLDLLRVYQDYKHGISSIKDTINPFLNSQRISGIGSTILTGIVATSLAIFLVTPPGLVTAAFTAFIALTAVVVRTVLAPAILSQLKEGWQDSRFTLDDDQLEALEFIRIDVNAVKAALMMMADRVDNINGFDSDQPLQLVNFKDSIEELREFLRKSPSLLQDPSVEGAQSARDKMRQLRHKICQTLQIPGMNFSTLAATELRDPYNLHQEYHSTTVRSGAPEGEAPFESPQNSGIEQTNTSDAGRVSEIGLFGSPTSDRGSVVRYVSPAKSEQEVQVREADESDQGDTASKPLSVSI